MAGEGLRGGKDIMAVNSCCLIQGKKGGTLQRTSQWLEAQA